MDKYNLTGITTSVDVLKFFQNSSAIIGGYTTGYLIMIMAFGVFFLHLLSNGNDIKEALAGSSWILLITSFLLRAMSLIGDTALYIGIAFVPLSIMILYFDSER